MCRLPHVGFMGEEKSRRDPTAERQFASTEVQKFGPETGRCQWCGVVVVSGVSLGGMLTGGWPVVGTRTTTRWLSDFNLVSQATGKWSLPSTPQ